MQYPKQPILPPSDRRKFMVEWQTPKRFHRSYFRLRQNADNAAIQRKGIVFVPLGNGWKLA